MVLGAGSRCSGSTCPGKPTLYATACKRQVEVQQQLHHRHHFFLNLYYHCCPAALLPANKEQSGPAAPLLQSRRVWMRAIAALIWRMRMGIVRCLLTGKAT